MQTFIFEINRNAYCKWIKMTRYLISGFPSGQLYRTYNVYAILIYELCYILDLKHV